MKIGMYSILDTAVQAFNHPFYARTEKEALRMLEMSVKSDKNFMANPRDYVMYSVAVFDDGSGFVEGHEPKRMISVAECLAAMAERTSGERSE